MLYMYVYYIYIYIYIYIDTVMIFLCTFLRILNEFYQYLYIGIY